MGCYIVQLYWNRNLIFFPTANKFARNDSSATVGSLGRNEMGSGTPTPALRIRSYSRNSVLKWLSGSHLYLGVHVNSFWRTKEAPY